MLQLKVIFNITPKSIDIRDNAEKSMFVLICGLEKLANIGVALDFG